MNFCSSLLLLISSKTKAGHVSASVNRCCLGFGAYMDSDEYPEYNFFGTDSHKRKESPESNSSHERYDMIRNQRPYASSYIHSAENPHKEKYGTNKKGSFIFGRAFIAVNESKLLDTNNRTACIRVSQNFNNQTITVDSTTPTSVTINVIQTIVQP